MALKKVYSMDGATSTVNLPDRLLYISQSPETDENITLKKHRDYINEGILATNDGASSDTSLVRTTSDAFTGGTGTVSLGVNISGLTALSVTPATGDFLQIYDTSETQIKKISVANLVAAAAGGGDVTGPSGATGDTLPLFDGITGKTIKDSTIAVSGSTITAAITGDVTGNLTGNVTGAVSGNVTGNLTGNVTGDVTGDVTGTLTGNAATATQLITSRTILGQAFDGTANVSADITDLDDVYTSMSPSDGQIFTYDATNSRWDAEDYPTGTGTVTAVRLATGAGSGLTISGSPITTDSTITLGLSSIPNTALANTTMTVAGQVSTLGGADTPITTRNLSDVDDVAPSDNNVLQWSASAGEWIPTALGTGGTVVSVGSGDGLTGGAITSSGTLSVDLTDTATFTSTNTASKAVVRDGSGDFAAGTITAALTGRADTAGIAEHATALETARNIGGVSFDGTADMVPATITVADTTDTTTFVGLWESATGDLEPKTDAGITYNASTAELSATTFVGALTGNASGTAANITGNLAVANLNSGSGAGVDTFWRGDGTWQTPASGDPAGTAVAMAIALGG